MKRILSAMAMLFVTLLSHTFLLAQQQCTGFRTQTQGGWGADPNGNNPGVYLHANFAAAFPNGVVIGCGGNTLTLTTAQAFTDFLPSTTTPAVLPPGNMVDPGSSYSNVFAGQLTTAVLNVGFDAYDPNFSSNPIHTGDLVIVSGTFAGWTINQLIAEANSTIGGCSNTYTPSELTDALDAFNKNYDNGTKDAGYTTCPTACSLQLSGTTTDVTCNKANNGSIDITASGASGNVTYLWNDGSTDEDRNNLAPGNYSVTVNAKNCEATKSFEIKEPSALDISAITVNISTVNGNDGSIDLTVTGGTGPYTYLWSDGNTDEDRSNLPAGSYSVTVTDKNGCSANGTYTLSEPECNISVAGQTTNVKCYGDNNGAIDITVSGANGNVTYLWNDGNTDEDRTNLAPGSYSVTVTDAAGCSTSKGFTITQPAKPLKVKGSITHTTAPKLCNGAVQLKITGGTPPYTATWNDGYIGTTRTALCKGAYTVTVVDANGCIVVCKIKVKCITTTQLTVSGESSLITRSDVSISLSPNPTKGIAKLSFESEESGAAVVNIVDMTGRKISSEKFGVSQGTNVKNIDLSGKAKGIYNVELIVNGERKLVKIVLQ